MSNETPAEMTTASLSAMKLPELKALAASRGLKGISQLRKPQLIELLSNDASAPTTPAAAPRDEAPASSSCRAPIGYVTACPAHLPHPDVAPGDGEIQRLYIVRGHQGGGRGTALLRTALEWLERDGPRTLWIGVWSENYGAQRFYARHGFEVVGEYSFMVGDHADREFITRRPSR